MTRIDYLDAFSLWRKVLAKREKVFSMNWRSGSHSLTEDRSSANMRAPQKNPLTVTPGMSR